MVASSTFELGIALPKRMHGEPLGDGAGPGGGGGGLGVGPEGRVQFGHPSPGLNEAFGV